MASVGILIFLLLVLFDVLTAAVERLPSGGAPIITLFTFVVMGATFLSNLGVVLYERAAGRRLTMW